MHRLLLSAACALAASTFAASPFAPEAHDKSNRVHEAGNECSDLEPSDERRRQLADSLAAAELARPTVALRVADTLVVYAGFDTTGALLESSAAVWRAGSIRERLSTVLPITAASGRVYSTGYMLLKGGRPLVGTRRAMFGWVFLCN